MSQTDTPEILVLQTLMPDTMEALDRRFRLHRLDLADDREAFLDAVAGRVRGVVLGTHTSAPAALFARLPKLEIVAKYGVGYDTVDAAAAHRHGVIVTNTPDVLSEEVADLTIGLLLAVVRRIPQADRYLREGHWPRKNFPLTGTLRGRRIGILGLGRIGRAIAERLSGFGVEIAYHGRRRQDDVPHAYHDTVLGLAGACDVLVVVAPATPETRNLVDAGVLRALGPNGIVVNVARGSLVDEPALIEALRDGTILAAGLDVFANEPEVPEALRALDNVVLLPHVGSASIHTRRMMGELLVENLVSWFSGKGPLSPVPETPWMAP